MCGVEKAIGSRNKTRHTNCSKDRETHVWCFPKREPAAAKMTLAGREKIRHASDSGQRQVTYRARKDIDPRLDTGRQQRASETAGSNNLAEALTWSLVE
jgi:hypothetical protein